MDLNSFALSLQQSSLQQTNSLMPKQQTSRSVGNNDYSEFIISAQLYQSRELNKQWILKYSLSYPIGTSEKPSTAILEAYARDYLASHTDAHDLPYIHLESVNPSYMIFSFNHTKWFADNFHTNGNYELPITITWKYVHDIPRIIFVNSGSQNDLTAFVQARFGEFLKQHKHWITIPQFKFLSSITTDMFEYRLDRVAMRMNANLKWSVILGSMALFMALFGKENMTTTQFGAIKNKIKSTTDVRQIAKYLRNLS